MKWARNFGYLTVLALVFLVLASTLVLHSRLPSPRTARRSPSSPQPLSPQAQVLLSSLIDAGKFADLRWPDFSDYRRHVLNFYQLNSNSLRWTNDLQPTSQALALIKLLQAAEEKGLSSEDYDGSRWNNRLQQLRPAVVQPDASDAVRFDLALTVTAMRYISDLHIGKINPQRLDFDFDESPKKYNLAEFLTEHVVNAADVTATLAQIEPPYPGYRRTIQALQVYQRIAREDSGENLPDSKKPILPGDAYAGVPRLTTFLTHLGDLPPGTPDPVGNTYQGALVDAVRHFQDRHGLPADGRLDTRTIAELNVPLIRRIRQMQLVLERWRWLPTEYQDSPVIANIPEFRLRAYDSQFHIMVAMNVVVGKAYGHHTPIFANKMRYVIFRPYWQVPPSIAQNEILPTIERKPGYFEKENLEFVDRNDNPVSPETTGDALAQRIRHGEVFLRQKPGPKNSLGLLKFIFPNEFDVYMHDTPATELFAKSRRDFSHGCIRLEKPADLAAWVLRDNPGWTPERIEAAMHGQRTEQVNLAHPIPVLIVYGTVIVLEDGIVHFYDDIYGHDAELEQALAHGYPYAD